MGAFLTVFVAVATLFFLSSKTLTILEKQDVDLMSAVIDNAIDFNFKFTAEQGFFISAALTRYNQNETVTEEPRYGELIFEHFGWGNEDISVDRRTLNTHYCSDEELGLRRTEKTVMFPLIKSAEAELRTYRKKFKCVDREDL